MWGIWIPHKGYADTAETRPARNKVSSRYSLCQTKTPERNTRAIAVFSPSLPDFEIAVI